jgi:hypothetical protein
VLSIAYAGRVVTSCRFPLSLGYRRTGHSRDTNTVASPQGVNVTSTVLTYKTSNSTSASSYRLLPSNFPLSLCFAFISPSPFSNGSYLGLRGDWLFSYVAAISWTPRLSLQEDGRSLIAAVTWRTFRDAASALNASASGKYRNAASSKIRHSFLF